MYWLYFCVVLIAICFTGLYFFQEKFIFLNEGKLDKDYSFEFSDNFEEIFLKTKDGNAINAIHFKLKNPYKKIFIDLKKKILNSFFEYI